MTVHAKPCGFRTHLGNRCAIPTFPPPRRLLDSFNTNQERSFPPPSPRAYFRLILQLEKTLGIWGVSAGFPSWRRGNDTNLGIRAGLHVAYMNGFSSAVGP